MAQKPFRIIQFEWSSVTFKMSFWISRQLPRLEKNSKCSNLYIRLLRHNKRSIVSEKTFSCDYMSKFPKCSTIKNWLSSTSFIYGSVDIFSTYHKSLWYTEYHTLCKKHFRSWNFALHDTKIFVWLNMLRASIVKKFRPRVTEKMVIFWEN